MKLAIFNGSPRKEKSNSDILINHFLTGYNRVYTGTIPVYYIAAKQKHGITNAIEKADILIVFFPLYVDCMPGVVKEFFENISDLDLIQEKKIGYIVQSGFPEAIHSIYVERYLKKLTVRLHCEYLGTVIKGGVEGIQMLPNWATKKLFNRFQDLGEYFARTCSFSPEIQERLRKPYRLSVLRKILLNITIKTGFGISDFYWNSHLKKNGAFRNRFDKPFIEEMNGV